MWRWISLAVCLTIGLAAGAGLGLVLHKLLFGLGFGAVFGLGIAAAIGLPIVHKSNIGSGSRQSEHTSLWSNTDGLP